MRTIVTIVLVMLVSVGTMTAQNGERPQRTQWGNKMLEIKHEMIEKETEMTTYQKEQFMPLYEAMEKEVYVVNRDARELEKSVSQKENATDADFEQAATAMSQVKVKEGEIEAKYFEKFTKILSKKQLFQLKRAENKFTRDMLSRGKKDDKKRK